MSANQLFTRMATATSRFAGRPVTFLSCCAIVLLWAVSGPIFQYSDTWQLVINTGTTIVTFLMVFLIQNTQNRDSAALHAKLDELIRVGKAQNSFIGIEHLTEEELDRILANCESRDGRRTARQEREQVLQQVESEEKAAPRKPEGGKSPEEPQSGRKARAKAKPANAPRTRAARTANDTASRTAARTRPRTAA